jgi:hypothetical protein
MNPPIQSATENYETEWIEYRRMRNTGLLVWLGGVPLIGALQLGWGMLFHNGYLFSVLGSVWFLACIFYGLRYQLWRCPRCNEIYAGKFWYHLGPFARHCVHCGLPKP